MCGIVGYIGGREAAPVLLEGLRRLEYRGYDSTGLAVHDGSGLHLRRSAGKVDRLQQLVERSPLSGSTDLGHTRWATHGRPSDANAHPHSDCQGRLAVVHNGILENYRELKARLAREGQRFASETDTEVMAHLVEHFLSSTKDLATAVKAALREIRGAYAFCILSTDEPGRIVAAKRGGGAVVVGLREGELFVASDIPAALPHSRSVLILEDGEVAVLAREGVTLYAPDDVLVTREPAVIAWGATMAQKGGFEHFMLKEIHEQPEAVAATFRGYVEPEMGVVSLPDAGLSLEVVARLRRVLLVSCGTSYHAALVGRLMIERLSGLCAEADLASELRYHDPVLGPDTLVVAISQSGETADTLGAAKTARERGAHVLAITNVVGSALTREAHGVVYVHAGPEIGVASTKTFTATLTACYLLALRLGLDRAFVAPEEGRKRIADLLEVPALIGAALEGQETVRELARRLARHESFLYLGRGVHHPLALEGALKLKEITYIHAEGYAGGEMKHGPIALIDERLPVVALTPHDQTYERMVANVEEVKARGGRIIAVCHRGDTEPAGRADHVLEVPPAVDLLAPLVTVVPLQLLAYYIAILRGCDVDQPRNLAKSVTVE